MITLGSIIEGNEVYEDARVAWWKVDGVYLGRSGVSIEYKSGPQSIGTALDEICMMPHVQIVNYNTKYRTVELKNEIDASLDRDNVAYIRASAGYLTRMTRAFGQSNGISFVPVGFNAFWMGYGPKADTWPTRDQILEVFTTASQTGSTTIRSHTLGFNPHLYQGQASAWSLVDYAFLCARNFNMKLIVPFTDNYAYYHGGYTYFTEQFGLQRDLFWTDGRCRQAFKTYIKTWLNHPNPLTGVLLKEEMGLGMIELGNELGNIRVSDDRVPPAEWLQDMLKFVQNTTSRDTPRLDGTDEALGASNNFTIGSNSVFSRHYYHLDLENVHSTQGLAWRAGRPFIIGEYDSKWSRETMAQIRTCQVSGTLAWNFMPHAADGSRVVNEDGYSFYSDDSAIVDVLREHNLSMRALGN